MYPKLRTVMTLDEGHQPTNWRDTSISWSRDKCYLELRGLRWARSWLLQKFICIIASCESMGFNFGRSNHRRCSVKNGVLKKFEKLTEKHGFDTGFLLSVLRDFWELFYRTFPGECFWRRGLMVKSFNLYHWFFLIHNFLILLRIRAVEKGGREGGGGGGVWSKNFYSVVKSEKIKCLHVNNM